MLAYGVQFMAAVNDYVFVNIKIFQYCHVCVCIVRLLNCYWCLSRTSVFYRHVGVLTYISSCRHRNILNCSLQTAALHCL